MSKRKSFSVEEKVHIITRLENGEANKDVCTELGVSKSTISSIWHNRDKIKAEFEKSAGISRKKMRTSNFSAIEDALLKWFKMHRSINIPINGPILQNKANDFARLLNVPDFNCSASWIHRFCQRNSIVFGKISGEDKSVPPGVCEDWIKKVWPTLRTGYTDEQIFNADETGLFYRLTPDRTYRFKGEKCTGGKLSKDRITVLVAANMTGSEKRKLVVIGKSKNPRCLKNVKNLPVVYESNKRAWMTSDLFEKMIRNWETELRKKGKKILLLVDNCPAHPVIENLEFIKLVFLPPNSTSKLQPLDQGVIRCLKVYFRKLIILHTLTSIEKKIVPKISILDAIILISRSWDCVSSLTIQNCFKHAGFIDDPSDKENDVSVVASEIVTWAQSLQLNANDTEVEEFINLDEQIEVYGQLTDEEIALPAANIPEDDDEEEEEEVEQPPTIDDAYKAVSIIQKFALFNDIETDSFSKIEHKIHSLYSEKFKKQTKITDFFKES